MPRLDPPLEISLSVVSKSDSQKIKLDELRTLTRAPFPGCGTYSNRLVHLMTARGVEDLGERLLCKIATSGSFSYGIEPFPHQPLQSEYLECEESARKPTAWH